MQNPYLLLQQDFAELLARHLPDDALHLQSEKRSENFGRVQAGALHEVVNRLRPVCAEQFVPLFLRPIERGGGDAVEPSSALGLRGIFPEDGVQGLGEEIRVRLGKD